MPYTPDARTTIVAILAIAVGLTSGRVNLWLLGVTSERLSESANAKPFVLSSLLRVGVFAIVAGIFAAVGPWWTSALYIVSLFIPLASYVYRMQRER